MIAYSYDEDEDMELEQNDRDCCCRHRYGNDPGADYPPSRDCPIHGIDPDRARDEARERRGGW